MKVVPTQFVTESNRTYDVYQHTVNSHVIRNSAMPSIYFRFDISPVAVRMQESRDSLYHFFVHVCAIVQAFFFISTKTMCFNDFVVKINKDSSFKLLK